MKLFVFVNIIICLSVVVTAEYGNASVCAKCLSDTEKLADEIKKATVDIAPLTTCAAIGDAVSKATKNPLAGVVVGAICEVVGFEAFKKGFNKTELNYGWYCEFRNKCTDKIGAGSIDSVGVNSPLKLGDDIKLKIIFSVSKEAGVLEFLFTCLNKTDTKYTKVFKQFEFPVKVGRWEAEWEIPTDKNWVIRNYTCTINLCTTICNSLPKKPTFGEKEVKFVIDKK